MSDGPDTDGPAGALRQVEDGLVGIAVGIAEMGQAVGQVVRERPTVRIMLVVTSAVLLNQLLGRTVAIAVGLFAMTFVAPLVWWVVDNE